MLKKIVTTAAISALAAFTLSACGSFSKVQTEQQKHAMPFCGGLHINNATWDYTDQFGNQIHVIGDCRKGMMHGGFTYMMDGKLVAKSKFSKNSEIKTSCVVNDKKYYSTLAACLNDAANAKGAAQQQAQQPEQQYMLVPVDQAPATAPAAVPAEVQQ